MEQRKVRQVAQPGPTDSPVIDLKKSLFKKGYAPPLSLKAVMQKSVKPIFWGSLFTATLMGLLAWRQGRVKEAAYDERVKQEDFATAVEHLKEQV